jgi:DNA-binding GntR family transcriptional regulator
MGERLVETKLAEELGMSRAPVREALRRLLEEGLVVERAHYGMFVQSFDWAEIVDLYNARVGLETIALRLFVRRGASTNSLRAQIERRRAAAEAGDVSEVVAADFAFHEEVFLGSGNSILSDFFRRLAAQTLIAITLADDVELEFAGQHVPIIEALERGDEEAAIDALFRVAYSAFDRTVAQLEPEVRALIDTELLITRGAVSASSASGDL